MPALQNKEAPDALVEDVGEVDALRQGLHRCPPKPGLQPDGGGTSFFTFGDSDQTAVPCDMENGDACQKERPCQHENSATTLHKALLQRYCTT